MTNTDILIQIYSQVNNLYVPSSLYKKYTQALTTEITSCI